jgi:hypothetical protein
MITIRQALSRPMFTVVEREKTPGIFQLRYGEIATVFTVEIRPTERGRYLLDASHGIRTDLQAGPYFVRDRDYASPGEALTDFQTAFGLYYKAAVRAGYRPREEWLVPDEACLIQDAYLATSSTADDGPTAVPSADAITGSNPERGQRSRQAKRTPQPRNGRRSTKQRPQTRPEAPPIEPLSPALNAAVPERDGSVTSPQLAVLDRTANAAVSGPRLKPKLKPSRKPTLKPRVSPRRASRKPTLKRRVN